MKEIVFDQVSFNGYLVEYGNLDGTYHNVLYCIFANIVVEIKNRYHAS